MPLPNRHQGRPDTRVITQGWGQSHSSVVDRAATGHGTITPPTGATKATVNDDLSVAPGTAPTPTYTGPFRVQLLGAQEAHDIVGDQEQVTAVYLAVARYDAVAERGSIVKLDTCNDPSLVGKPLRIVKVGRGTDRFERDLWVVDVMPTRT